MNKFYIKGATELGRLHRISYDPILTIITETIKGIDVIRTENVEKNFRELIYKRLDDHFGVHLYIEGSKQWYNLVLRIASSLFNFACLFYIGLGCLFLTIIFYIVYFMVVYNDFSIITDYFIFSDKIIYLYFLYLLFLQVFIKFLQY